MHMQKTKSILIVGVCMSLLLLSMLGFAQGESTTRIISLDPRGDDEYNLIFSGNDESSYVVPFITNEGGAFKYGDDNDDFVFVEAANVLMPNIGIRDYVALSQKKESYIVRYTGIDTNERTIFFQNLKNGLNIAIPYDPASDAMNQNGTLGIAKLFDQFDVYISNKEEDGINLLAIDMNGNGKVNGNEVRFAHENVRVDFGESNYSGNGKTIPVVSSVLTTSDRTDRIKVTVEKRTGNRIGLNGLEGISLRLAQLEYIRGETEGVIGFEVFDAPRDPSMSETLHVFVKK